MIEIPVSIGELFDKITILKIKKERIKSLQKIENVEKELELLTQKSNSFDINRIHDEYDELKKVNLILWEVEDKIRKKENENCFDDEFIKLARTVYIENDKRAALKRRINEIMNSDLIEEKEY
jgi:hypothetical protein